MNSFCNVGGGCKSNDTVWGIINTVKNTLHRLTFSKSLADHIVDGVGEDFEVRQFGYVLGDKLPDGQPSPTGMYALVSSLKDDLVLRIGLIKETSELMVDEDSRYLASVKLAQL